MGAARDIPVYRFIGKPNQNGDGKPGLTYGWMDTTGTYRTRKDLNNLGVNRGSYFVDGETWYGIIACSILSTGHQPNRTFNWHDFPVSGYNWGYVSPLAWDCYLPGGTSFDTGNQTEFTMEYTSSAPNPTKWYSTPFNGFNGQFQFFFVKVKFSVGTAGTLDVWVQNSTTSLSDGPVISISNKRTLDQLNGTFPGAQFWQGMYQSQGFTSGPNMQVDHMMSMWGQSWQQAWDDAPQFVQFITNNPNPATAATCTAIGSINTATFPIPTSIAAQLSDPPGGGGSSGGTTGTLGKTNIGASWNTISTPYIFANKYVIPAGKTYRIDDIQAYLRGNPGVTASENLKAVIWADSAGLPGNVLSIFTTATLSGGPTGTAANWMHFTPSVSAPSLTGSIWVGFINQGTSAAGQIAYDPGVAGALQFKTSGAYSTIAVTNPFGTPDGNATDTFSLYMDWTDVTAGVPTNTTAPICTVDAIVGQVLTCDTGVWTGTPSSYSYQWQRDVAGNLVFANIGGETAAAHTCVSADIGCHLRCNVIATNGTGASAAAASNVSAVVIDAIPVQALNDPPVVTGDARVGNTLTVTHGTWSGSPTFTYQWLRGDGVTFTNIAGANATTYVLVAADLGTVIRCLVTATNAAGSASNSANIGPVLPTPTAPGTPPDTPPVVLPVAPSAGLGSGVKTGVTEPANKVRDMGKGLVDPGE